MAAETAMKEKWKVVVDSDNGWKDAWDEILPGYIAKLYDTEQAALAAARQLRSTLQPGQTALLWDAATVRVDVEED